MIFFFLHNSPCSGLANHSGYHQILSRDEALPAIGLSVYFSHHSSVTDYSPPGPSAKDAESEVSAGAGSAGAASVGAAVGAGIPGPYS